MLETRVVLTRQCTAPDRLTLCCADCLPGNVTKVKAQKKTLSNKEKKKRERLRAAKKKAGEPVSDSDEDDW